MPLIPELAQAMQALDEKERNDPFRLEIEALEQKLAALRAVQSIELAPHRQREREAQELQSRTLTKWHRETAEFRLYRYILHLSGPKNPNWSHRAWLRMARDSYTDIWWWTLDYRHADGFRAGGWETWRLAQVKQQPGGELEQLSRVGLEEELIARADKRLIKAGWNLSDLENE